MKHMNCGRTRLISVIVWVIGASVLHGQETPKPASTEPKGEKDVSAPLPKDPIAQKDPGRISEPDTPLPLRKPPAPEPAVIREPSQGRPIFITARETFYIVMRLTPDFKGNVSFVLRNAMEPTILSPLKPKTEPSFVNNEFCHLLLQVGPNVEPGLYDLVVRTGTATYQSKHCISVVDRFKDRFRFVHLSNMNVGDLTAPDFDDMLPHEINLLAPAFIVATGNYTEWSRVLDDSASWQRVLKYFEKFNAPVFMLCGVHDHQASFTRFIASKPIGTIDYGNYHGLLLLDHAANPIDQDYTQIQWIDTDLRQHRQKNLNFIVASSNELALLDVWRERGNIEDFIHEHKVKMFIVGGSTDWDYKEFASKLNGLDDLHFIRTHEASTCLRDRATGFSHYRVIEIDGERVSYVYPNDNAAERLQHSIPTGRLRAFYDAANDGTASRVGVTVQNALNQGFENARVWLRVAKNGQSGKPTVAPGRVVRMLDVKDYWACEIACDLPDKGAVRIVASMNPSDAPPPPPVALELDGPRTWTFAQQTTDFGLGFFESEARVQLKLTNQSDKTTACWPVIRINGAQIRSDPSVLARLPMQIKPGESISIPLVLNLRRVSPGTHKLQVHFLEDPLNRVHTFDVNLAIQERVSKRDGGNP